MIKYDKQPFMSRVSSQALRTAGSADDTGSFLIAIRKFFTACLLDQPPYQL